LKIYTALRSNDVERFFDYLHWFQIFKDQCGSVPSISVAVLVLRKGVLRLFRTTHPLWKDIFIT
jgi:hypothetical protein